MRKLAYLVVAGIFAGSFIAPAHAASTNGGNDANLHESYQKKALEDFQLKKKRLANDYDAALKGCAKESGHAQADCRKLAKADFNNAVKRERTVYEEALHSAQGSGSSGNSGNARKAGGGN